MRGWEVSVPPDPEDEYNVYTYNQAVVGLAFAELKLHAACSGYIASMALQALESQRKMPEPKHWDANVRKSRLRLIEQMKRILEQCT